jgi:hypothetical protein
MNITNLTPQQLRKAADLKEKIDALQGQMDALLGGGEIPILGRGTRTGKRRLSAQGRANIAAAAKARWAALRSKKGAASVQTPSTPSPAAKKLHWTQTPEGKARLARSIKRSWRKRQRA